MLQQYKKQTLLGSIYMTCILFQTTLIITCTCNYESGWLGMEWSAGISNQPTTTARSSDGVPVDTPLRVWAQQEHYHNKSTITTRALSHTCTVLYTLTKRSHTQRSRWNKWKDPHTDFRALKELVEGVWRKEDTWWVHVYKMYYIHVHVSRYISKSCHGTCTCTHMYM